MCKHQIVRALSTGKKCFFVLGPPPCGLNPKTQHCFTCRTVSLYNSITIHGTGDYKLYKAPTFEKEHVSGAGSKYTLYTLYTTSSMYRKHHKVYINIKENTPAEITLLCNARWPNASGPVYTVKFIWYKLHHWETLGPKTDPAPKEESDHVTN